MAKTDEEEYLDSLLKSMSMDESDNTTKKVNDTDIKNSSEELDNFAPDIIYIHTNFRKELVWKNY